MTRSNSVLFALALTAATSANAQEKYRVLIAAHHEFTVELNDLTDEQARKERDLFLADHVKWCDARLKCEDHKFRFEQSSELRQVNATYMANGYQVANCNLFRDLCLHPERYVETEKPTTWCDNHTELKSLVSCSLSDNKLSLELDATKLNENEKQKSQKEAINKILSLDSESRPASVFEFCQGLIITLANDNREQFFKELKQDNVTSLNIQLKDGENSLFNCSSELNDLEEIFKKFAQ